MQRSALFVLCAITLAAAPAIWDKIFPTKQQSDAFASTSEDGSLRVLVAARTHIPQGRALTYVLPAACSYRVGFTSRKTYDRIDVALVPQDRWDAWASCRGDLDVERDVLCTATSSCTVRVAGINSSQPHVLLIGRRNLGLEDAAVRLKVSGSGNGCTDNVTKLIEVPPSTVQQHTLPYRGGAVLPLVKARGPSIQQYSTHTRDVQSGAGIGHVVWLNDRRTRSFMQTVQRTRSRVNGVAAAAIGGMRGLAAQRRLRKGTIVLKVSRSAVLQTPLLRNDSTQVVATLAHPAFWTASDSGVRLALVLLAEKRRGEESPLAGWIRSLPRGADLPCQWSREQLQDLQYEPLLGKIDKQRREWRKAYRDLQTLTPGTDITAPEFYWALEMVKSRAFNAPKDGVAGLGEVIAWITCMLILGLLGMTLVPRYQPVAWLLLLLTGERGLRRFVNAWAQLDICLVPGMDWANHASSPQVVNIDVGYSTLFRGFRATTTQIIEQGDEVWNSYGPRTNDELLQWYGFVNDDNPKDVYWYDDLLRHVRDLHDVEPSRMQMLTERELGEALDQVKLTGAGFPKEVVQSLRLLAAPSDEAAEVITGPSAMPVQETRRPERQVALLMHELLVAERDRKNTSLQEDLALQASPTRKRLHPRAALALQFRIQKKKILSDAIAATEGLLYDA
eukprot:CAMPEP_0206144966 /NCGR_PEP_ID=MMETSP1473-20131121/25960_1 /ASSEMBLY_ACC=CAM_ASM_001109 /TAXON_ID=1461547 /ORGANISM="Stichococcus sp, Strain RCC1054" /LENGTH=674 /DNA_ID=CAMNT_0053541001 /DNA_START=77 /DNA_END=2101 /DNA_ORIENTATION=-